MKYKYLLFDADDTLLDFQLAERESLKKTFADHNIELTKEIYELYSGINLKLWQDFENGKILKSEILVARFSTLFSVLKINMDSYAFEEEYMENLSASAQTISGAIELLKELRNQYDIYIVTNGVAKTQERRLRESGLDSLILDSFTSETVGAQKPSKEYFDYVFSHIEGFDKSRVLLIGDSLNSDIKGGLINGIDTCWYNPRSIKNHVSVQPTYEIRSFEELKEIIK